MILKEIREILIREGIIISPRVEMAIRRYCDVAKDVMVEDDYGISSNVIALDYALSQRVLTKIIGNGEGYRMWLQTLQDYCSNNNLLKCTSIIKNILDRGEREMMYYQFFG